MNVDALTAGFALACVVTFITLAGVVGLAILRKLLNP